MVLDSTGRHNAELNDVYKLTSMDLNKVNSTRS